MNFETLEITIEQGVATLALNRPTKVNAMNLRAWQELRQALELLDAEATARVVVLRGNGKHFCAGIDLELLATADAAPDENDRSGAHGRETLRRWVLEMQDYVTAFERCRKPVIAAIHGYCLGGGVDIATACDMRYAAADATFSVKEIELAVVADMGTIQRLPTLVGEGVARELVFTGRNFDGREAERLGLVNRSYATADELFTAVAEIARGIAAKSPLAMRGCKEALLFARDNSVAAALNHVATWNAAVLASDDFREALAAFREKRPAVYRD